MRRYRNLRLHYRRRPLSERQIQTFIYVMGAVALVAALVIGWFVFPSSLDHSGSARLVRAAVLKA